MEMLEEQLAVVRGAWADGPFSFEGKHYRLAPSTPAQARAAPAPAADHRRRREAAQRAHRGAFANEYNTVYATPAECAERRVVCERAWLDAGRDPATLTFSVMVPWLVGADAADLGAAPGAWPPWQGSDAAA